ncbi:uncharacterized protein LOC120632189 [Pararge aegeria]|uniref:uncharacterized protein LOC120632189 n=1 Tax=Pararge aegeria TaxID=116150 RepID=UPI0019D141C7|nr:uncharacterized protein LOC120632189 [Pararge aegeria]
MVDWDMIIIALLAEEEEMEEHINKIRRQKVRRRIWVEECWQERCSYGEFNTLCTTLPSKGVLFYDYYKMDYEKFRMLVEILRPYIQKKTTNYRSTISIEERLTICLRFLTVGSSFKSLAFNYRVGYSTVRSIVYETCAAIWKVLQPIVMPKPTEETWSQIEEGFKNIWQFPNCIGALDGKHVQIRSPHNSGSQFYNYKKSFSTVLLAVVDANYKFVIVDVGAYGRNSDGGILSNSKLGQKLNNTLHIPQNKCLPSTNKEIPHVFVADEAFPLTNNIMRPFPGNDIRGDEQKKIFNYRLSRARRMVESAFGIMVQKYEVFQRPLKVQPHHLDKIILACTCLHNFLIDEKYIHTQSHESNQSEIIFQDFEQLNEEEEDGSNVTESMKIRDEFKKYFSSEAGSVHWQDNIINRRC